MIPNYSVVMNAGGWMNEQLGPSPLNGNNRNQIPAEIGLAHGSCQPQMEKAGWCCQLYCCDLPASQFQFLEVVSKLQIRFKGKAFRALEAERTR
jgi:hypothetical protein